MYKILPVEDESIERSRSIIVLNTGSELFSIDFKRVCLIHSFSSSYMINRFCFPF